MLQPVPYFSIDGLSDSQHCADYLYLLRCCFLMKVIDFKQTSINNPISELHIASPADPFCGHFGMPTAELISVFMSRGYHTLPHIFTFFSLGSFFSSGPYPLSIHLSALLLPWGLFGTGSFP